MREQTNLNGVKSVAKALLIRNPCITEHSYFSKEQAVKEYVSMTFGTPSQPCRWKVEWT